MRRIHNRQRDACLLAQSYERFDILREAASTIPYPRMQKPGSNALIQSHAFCDLADVCTRVLTELTEHIDEGDLGRKERVARILHNLRALTAAPDDRLPDASEWMIELINELASPGIIIDTDNDAIGLQCVLDSRSFEGIRDSRSRECEYPSLVP